MRRGTEWVELPYRAAHFFYRHYLGWYNRRMARRLAGRVTYDFTSDWTQGNVAKWEEVLKAYREKPGVRMLEIGSFQGRSAIWFLENVLTGPGSSLTCIDDFASLGNEPRFDHNLRLSGKAHQVEKKKGKSIGILPTLPQESFDIVYIDGDHRVEGVLLDAMLVWQRLKLGGVLIFDDYLLDLDKSPWDRPQAGIDVFLAMMEQRVECLDRGYQVILRKIP